MRGILNHDTPPAQEVMEHGRPVADWPCDTNEAGETESNGSIEQIIRYKGKLYSLLISWDDEEPFQISRVDGRSLRLKQRDI